MASINDWIIDGKNGLTFDVNNIDELSKYILFAITNEILLESAFTENQSLAIERINRYKIAKQLNKILNNIL
jgi:glycosyltransferase involved in cell wall biosynthesis